MVHDQKKPINPTLLFQRMSVFTDSPEDLADHFKYELAPYPKSIFLDGLMRQPTKSLLYRKFTPISNVTRDNCCYTIDGGMLLHRVQILHIKIL